MAFANTDLSNATYTAPNTGGTLISALTKLSQVVSILDFGGDPTGSSDTGPALTNAINSLLNHSGTIIFPSGIFRFNGSPTFSLSGTQSVTLVGAGQDATELYFLGTGGLSFFLASTSIYLGCSAHIRDMTFTTSRPVSTSGSAIQLINNSTMAANPAVNACIDVTRVTMRGHEGYTQGGVWGTAINIIGVSNVNIIGCSVIGHGKVGAGIFISGNAQAIPVVINVTSCVFDGIQSGLVYGDYAQGVTISQSNFTGCQFGVIVSTSHADEGLLQLTIQASQFGACDNGVYMGAPVAGTMIIGNLFLTNTGQYAVNLYQNSGFSFIGNQVLTANSTSGYGITVGTTFSNVPVGSITGNVFNGQQIAVWLQAGSKGVNVQSNCYNVNSSNVINSGISNIIGGGSI